MTPSVDFASLTGEMRMEDGSGNGRNWNGNGGKWEYRWV